MLDANEVLRPTGKFAEFLERLDLHDVHHNDPAPSTFIGSTNRRIDYIFGCHQLRGYMTSSGTLSYVDGPQSDHRGMFVDVTFADFVSYDANANPHLAAQARTLRIGNPELVTSYIHEMLQYYTSHRMEEQITNLHKNFKQIEKEDIKKELEAWDRDPGRAMKKAEKEISKPKQQYAWLPKLRNAAIIRRYWKLRFRDEQIRQSDYKFKLPLIDDDLTLDQIRSNLNSATTELHTLQKGATELRFKSYQDLLATYTSDNDPATRPESTRKAKIVQRTIRNERIRAMFRKIKNTMTQTLPNQQSGITRIKVPSAPGPPHQPLDPDEFQDYIARTPPNDIISDTVLDKETIEKYLIQNNRRSFRAAAVSPCGHGIIYKSISFTSLTTAAAQFLNGVLPVEWYGNDDLLRSFSLEFMIPQHIRNRPSIKMSLSSDDIVKGIKRWKESTSTSPSGRHLGHYKAIVQDPTLLMCLASFMHIAIKSGI